MTLMDSAGAGVNILFTTKFSFLSFYLLVRCMTLQLMGRIGRKKGGGKRKAEAIA